jgi:hypothetical protein
MWGQMAEEEENKVGLQPVDDEEDESSFCSYKGFDEAINDQLEVDHPKP